MVYSRRIERHDRFVFEGGTDTMSDTVQLMLVVECSPQSLDLLATALGQCHASCILIRPAGALTAVSQKGPDGAATGQRPALDYDAEVCAAIVALSQSHEIAALVANDVVVAKSALADGCHLDATDMIEQLYASAPGRRSAATRLSALCQGQRAIWQ